MEKVCKQCDSIFVDVNAVEAAKTGKVCISRSLAYLDSSEAKTCSLCSILRHTWEDHSLIESACPEFVINFEDYGSGKPKLVFTARWTASPIPVASFFVSAAEGERSVD